MAKVQTDKQRSTKHTHKTKERVTRTPLKTRGELDFFFFLNQGGIETTIYRTRVEHGNHYTTKVFF